MLVSPRLHHQPARADTSPDGWDFFSSVDAGGSWSASVELFCKVSLEPLPRPSGASLELCFAVSSEPLPRLSDRPLLLLDLPLISEVHLMMCTYIRSVFTDVHLMCTYIRSVFHGTLLDSKNDVHLYQKCI